MRSNSLHVWSKNKPARQLARRSGSEWRIAEFCLIPDGDYAEGCTHGLVLRLEAVKNEAAQ